MTRAKSLAAILAVGALAFGFLHGQQEDSRALPSLLPPGALLYLEAKDFRSLVNQWNSSAEKQKWLASANFGVLSRSRLVQRLGEARDQFTTVAGIPIAYNLVEQVAGGRSAFALYDLPNLRFVYLTKFESSRLNTNELWRSRTRYQSREAAGIPFFVNSDPATNRAIAVASYKDWLVITSSEDRMAQTLALLSGSQTGGLPGESWFSETAARSQEQGDLRLVYNLEALLPTPQFRTYWLQQNNSELKQFKSGIADLFERRDAFEEHRVLLRATPGNATGQASALSEILRYVPQPASLYRAWSLPNRDQLSDVLEQVVLAEQEPGAGPDRTAPIVSTSVSETGSASDFETRIDQPPFHRTQNAAVAELVNAVTAMQPRALLHVQSTVALTDGVFLLPESGAVLECAQPDRAALERALASLTDITQRGSLDPLHVAVSGNNIILSRVALSQSAASTQIAPGTTYTAVFNKAYEWPHYKRLFGLLDHRPGGENIPTFFSGNLGSLGDTLARLNRVSIQAQDGSAELRDTLRYELSTP